MGLFSRLFYSYLKEETCNVCANELKPGDKVKDINPGCKEKNAKGTVKSIRKVKDGKKIAGNLIEFEVENKGKHYKPGQKLKKTEIQLKKVSESFRVFISEETLSKGNLNANPPRIETLIRKLENKEPFAPTGSVIPSIIIDPDPAWLEDLKQTKQLKTTYIPTTDGRSIRLATLQKTKEFGSSGQRGKAFEDSFYNFISDRLKEGELKIKIKDKVFEVKSIEQPAGSKNNLADIVMDTNDGELFLSLKQNDFFTYGGITFKGRDYQKEISQLDEVKDYVLKFRKYLKSIGNCEERDGVVLCDPKGKRYYYEPEYDQDFVDIVLFGEEKFKDDKDYVDYVIIEGSSNEPIFNLENDVYVLNSSYKAKERGDKLDPIDVPVFLSRPRRQSKKDRYGFVGNRTMIARKRAVGNAINLKDLL